MGRSYYTVVFIGYKIKKSKLTKYERIVDTNLQLCKCPENNESNNYCPKCGNENIKTMIKENEIKYLKNYSHYNPYEAYGSKCEYTYIILRSAKQASHYDEVPVFTGAKELTVPPKIKNEFMTEVADIEPWNEDNYCLYTFIECNY